MNARADKQQMFRIFAVKIGIYFSIFAGVVSQSILSNLDPKTLELTITFGAWPVTRFLGGIIFATIIYHGLDGKGDITGKTKNVGRILMFGFTSGFTMMGITGIGG